MSLVPGFLAPMHSHRNSILLALIKAANISLVSHNVDHESQPTFDNLLTRLSQSTPGANYELGISHDNPDEPQGVFPSTLYNTQPALYARPLEPQDSEWPTSSGGDTPNVYASSQQVLLNVWSGHNQPVPSPVAPPQADVDTFGIFPVQRLTYSPAVESTVSQNVYPPQLRPPFDSNRDMGGFRDYPSPHSERGRQASVTTPTSMPESGVVGHATTPSPDEDKCSRISLKRGDPPRDARNQIFCAHPECAKDPPIFHRPCEWK